LRLGQCLQLKTIKSWRKKLSKAIVQKEFINVLLKDKPFHVDEMVNKQVLLDQKNVSHEECVGILMQFHIQSIPNHKFYSEDFQHILPIVMIPKDLKLT
jgi:hypothetical protein